MPTQNSVLDETKLSAPKEARKPSGRTVAAAFLLFAAIIAFSFFFRHISGMIVTHGAYNPLVYNPVEIRVTPAPKFDFLPDDVLWDETRAYARATQGFMRGDFHGPVFLSYAPYVEGPMPQARMFYRDGLGQLILSWMARVPGSSVPAAFCAADFIFVFALALGILAYCWELRSSIPFALTATTVLMCFSWQEILNLVAYLRGEAQNASLILRTPYPQLSLFVFLVFLVFLKRLVERPTWRIAVLFVITFTLNFYAYFYSWTLACLSLFATLGFLLVTSPTKIDIFGLSRESRNRAIWMLIGCGLVTAVLSFPMWTGVVRNTSDVIDSFRRLEGELTHRPNIKYTLLLGVLIPAAIYVKRKGFPVSWITIVSIVGGLGVLNLQVLTGKTIQPLHWSSYYIQPLLILGLLHLCWPFVERLRPQTLRIVVALVIVAGFCQNLAKFWTAAVESRDFNLKDPLFESVTARLQSPDFANYGFVTNDYYLMTVLPAYVRLKPLAPLYLDPISNAEMWELRLAALHAAGFDDWETFSRTSGQGGKLIEGLTPIRYKPERVVLVMNKHRMIPPKAYEGRCAVLSNADFEVLKPCTR